MTLKKAHFLAGKDWISPFTQGKEQTVEVSIHRDSYNKPLFRIAVWGQDDFGMEKEFYSNAEAFDCYRSLEGTTLSVEGLKKLGFVRA